MAQCATNLKPFEKRQIGPDYMTPKQTWNCQKFLKWQEAHGVPSGICTVAVPPSRYPC